MMERGEEEGVTAKINGKTTDLLLRLCIQRSLGSLDTIKC